MPSTIVFPQSIEQLARVRSEKETRDAKKKYLLKELKRVNGIIESECLPETVPFLQKYKAQLNAELGALK